MEQDSSPDADLATEIARLRSLLVEKDQVIATKDQQLATKDEQVAEAMQVRDVLNMTVTIL